ncbi:MAG: membrane protein insertase YidC [Armatimonadetes bacterium]|nr:membrane protein insertase YidC [Armatimonadota bacterium]
MDNARPKTIARGITLVGLVPILLAFALPALAAPVLFQAGLPEVLVIGPGTDEKDVPAVTDLKAEAERLASMAAWAGENRPSSGFIKKLMGSSDDPQPVSLDLLNANLEALRGKLVAVEGLYVPIHKDEGVLKGAETACKVTLPEGTPVEGFGGEETDRVPARVVGMVEAKGKQPVIRATLVTPSEGISWLRAARAYDLAGEYDDALEAYQKAESALRSVPGDLAAFCRVRSGQIAYDHLRNKKLASKHFNTAWTTYITNIPPGTAPLNVWSPEPAQKIWTRSTVHDAIGQTLSKLNSESFWYHFVAFFVMICGGNAALGILLLALVVRLIIWPLTRKQLESAAAMQKLQPQIKELQARYADDKQKFQTEFWALCQANGVNPLGGCLPLLVQMPILILIYQGIRLYIVEFDKASFLWVDNLAGPDMILLVAYTISMILFQKMTQKTNPQAVMDPQQQQQQKMMMYMMPLMFFFMFRTFPAAFILYWLGTNIVYFAQQWNYMRKIDHNAPIQGKRSGVVDAMARMLSGEPQEDAAAPQDKPADDVDRRSLEERRRDEKQAGKRKRRTPGRR